MPYAPISGSTYVNFSGFGITSQTTAQAAFGITNPRLFTGSDQGINVALILERNQDPTALLAGNWASRQQTLQQLDSTNSLWTKYGADPALYQTVSNALQSSAYGLTLLNGGNSNYVSSAESRTIWLEINSQADFQTLFQTSLYYSEREGGIWYWDGLLSLPTEWKVAGLWFDTLTSPPASNMAGVSVLLPPGPQSIGNDAPAPPFLAPQQVATLYNFPFNGQSAKTGTVGLIEPSIGSALLNDPSGTQFASQLQQYLTAVGRTGTGTVAVQGINGQVYNAGNGGERSLDVGLTAAINPNSDLVLYNGSGETSATGNAQASVFSAIQSAIWDKVHNPAVTTNSYGDPEAMAPGSPFYTAYTQLYVDAALRNQTTLIALGDGGSGNQTANGLVNVETNITSPYNILVGGSSLATNGIAPADPTLVPLVALANAGDPLTIWNLVAGGLKSLPSAAAPDSWLFESVWNEYAVTTGNTFVGGNSGPNSASYTQNNTSSGGVDTTQPAPWYQRDFGLTPTTVATVAGPGQTGRGVPDVAALAGGDMFFLTPNPDMSALSGNGGTSAATPFWAALITQVNAVFQDQGLPKLGFMTDLLYQAAAVAPGSLNDILNGNNVSSFTVGGVNYGGLTPTGYGYSAGPGYDLTSGLGSPNGLLLARTLTQVAQAQTWSKSPAVLGDPTNSFSGTSTVSQTLLVQDELGAGTSTLLGVGAGAPVTATGGAQFAWTSRLAEQALQKDFDPRLVTLLDGAAQGTTYAVSFNAGEGVAVYAGGVGPLPLYQASYTNPFGIVQFGSAGGDVTLARPVTVAQTAGGANNQDAIVRLRQVTTDSLKLEAYRVDDFNGTIAGVAPGQAQYAALAATRNYLTDNGTTAITGPGYGNYGEARLKGVNAGDIVAYHLRNDTTSESYWAFAAANETEGGKHVNHVYSYGLNTLGFEATKGGGDGDYNDLIIGIDYTSGSGHQLIA